LSRRRGLHFLQERDSDAISNGWVIGLLLGNQSPVRC
jgi:hypothetical protein